jgi:hypothetical protein
MGAWVFMCSPLSFKSTVQSQFFEPPRETEISSKNRGVEKSGFRCFVLIRQLVQLQLNITTCGCSSSFCFFIRVNTSYYKPQTSTFFPALFLMSSWNHDQSQITFPQASHAQWVVISISGLPFFWLSSTFLLIPWHMSWFVLVLKTLLLKHSKTTNFFHQFYHL